MVGIGARGQSGMGDMDVRTRTINSLVTSLLNVKLHHHDRELSTNYLGH